MTTPNSSPLTHPRLRSQRVAILGDDGSCRFVTLSRVWWRGDRPTRVVTSTGDALEVTGWVMPGEVYEDRLFYLRARLSVPKAPARPIRVKAKKTPIINRSFVGHDNHRSRAA